MNKFGNMYDNVHNNFIIVMKHIHKTCEDFLFSFIRNGAQKWSSCITSLKRLRGMKHLKWATVN